MFGNYAKNYFCNMLNSDIHYISYEGPSGLTVDAIAQHDAKHAEDEMVLGEDAFSDTQSAGATSAKTFKTWATNWTDCTNATFGKVHRYWSSNSALHKEVNFEVFTV